MDKKNMEFYGIFAECCKDKNNMDLETEWFPEFAVCKVCNRLFSINEKPESGGEFFTQWSNIIRNLKFHE